MHTQMCRCTLKHYRNHFPHPVFTHIHTHTHPPAHPPHSPHTHTLTTHNANIARMITHIRMMNLYIAITKRPLTTTTAGLSQKYVTTTFTKTVGETHKNKRTIKTQYLFLLRYNQGTSYNVTSFLLKRIYMYIDSWNLNLGFQHVP